ncbi:hypothetical protein Tco_0979439, partial [Tanacetum coccineum]
MVNEIPHDYVDDVPVVEPNQHNDVLIVPEPVLEDENEASLLEDANRNSLDLSFSCCPELDHEDLEQLDEFDLEEMDLKWQVAMILMRMKKFYKKTECRTKGNQDSKRRDVWNFGNKDERRSGKPEDSKALVTIDGEGVDWTSHSEEEEDYALMACNSSVSDTEITSCSKESLKKVEAQLVAHQQGQLWYEEKIRFMKINLDDKTDVLTYHKKLLAEAEKEKEDLKAKVEKWHNSSKNLGKLLNTQMSANDKFGLGYGDHRYDGILSYENEVLQSVFMNKESDLENQPLYDRFVTAEGMHVVPLPMTGNYMPSGPDIEIDYSQFTYGPKQSKPSESETQTSDFDTCESNISVETSEFVTETVVNEPKVVSQPKVWSDALIIEEYESDSEDEHVSQPTEEHETPSFANQRVKTPREDVKNQFTHSKNPKFDKKGLGYGFTTKACFVCGSLSHLIKDYDFQEKRMAKQVELNKQKAVLTRTGKIPVSTARASGTNNVSITRHNFNSQAVLTNAVRKISTVKPLVNRVRPKTVFHKTHSPFRRPFNNTTALRTNFSKQKVNTTEVNAVSDIEGKKGNCWHMTGNKAYLAEYQDFNGGPVAFGGSKGYITGKGKIKTGKLDFEDVCFVKELQHFSFMVKKSKHFSGKVTPLFASMLVQPTEDEGATSERPSEPQPTPSPPYPSEANVEPQSDPSPRPSPTTHIPDSIPESSGGNNGGHSSSDKSLSGNEGDMTLQSVYDLCISLCTQVTDQAKEIKHLKAQIKKLKKKAKPCNHTPRSLDEECLLEAKIGRKEILEKIWMQKESVSKQGSKSAKAEPLVHKDPLFDELPDDTLYYMDTQDAQDVGRTRDVVNEEKKSAEDAVSTEGVVSTDKEKVSTDRPNVSTDRPKVNTDKEKD